MKRLLALVVPALLLAVPAFHAGAAPTTKTFHDPDDMTSPVDVRELVWEDEGKDVHRFTLRTDDGWRCDYISKLGKMLWYFDGRGDREMDLIGKVRCLDPQDGPRELVMFLSGKSSGNNYEPIPINKPNRHTMKLVMSFDIPELSGPHVSVVVKVRDGQAEGCTSANPCTEKAPDNGRWRLY